MEEWTLPLNLAEDLPCPPSPPTCSSIPPGRRGRCLLGEGWWASGYNIAPAEVEGYLYHHLAVREAAVVGIPDAYPGEAVEAFIVSKGEVRGRVLRRVLRDREKGKAS